MLLTLKTKIWLTVLTIVLLFSFFILFYFPIQRQKYMMENYNKEVENLARTVALGVKIALTEQNFEGVQTAMEFVKNDPLLNYVAVVQADTVWNNNHAAFSIKRTVFKTYPEKIEVNPEEKDNELMIIKSAPFITHLMNGEILLSLSTREIMESKKQIRTTAMAVSGIVLVIGILIGFWLARHISVPVLELRDAAIKVGEGDRTQQVKKRTHDEIGELSDAFNKMVKDLVKAEEKVKAAQKQLVQAEKMASLGQLTAGIAHEIQNPLNFVNNFSDLSSQFISDFNSTQDEKEKTELLNAINENLKKIHYHGKRADNIIKSMLEHSRSGRSVKELADINQLCIESFNLAFQSMRSKDVSFNCTLEKNLAPGLPQLLLIKQDIVRVMINLFNNAFYSINERNKKENAGGEKKYRPQVFLSTELSGFSKIIVAVRDNGMGIPKEFRERIFQPFFSTKPSGEGTGLGLSLSYDIITKRHDGEISVNSAEGEGTEFVITLSVSSLYDKAL